MTRKLCSGDVKNETTTTYTAKSEDGKRMVEQVKQNKETGNVIRTVDGKPVETQKQDNQIKYSPGNGDAMMIILLNDIKRQLVEMNYYMAKLAKEDKQ